jgi:hypothetical protein
MLNASRNPYENAELFTMLERLRRKDEIDGKSDNELGELLMSVTKYAITCLMRSGYRLHMAPDEMESEALMYVIDVSRRANTEDPKAYVNCLIKAAQNRIRRMMRDTSSHNKVISYGVDESIVLDMTCSIDGTPHQNIWERIKLKPREAENG